ncbi:MAG: peptidase [Firmicutes bacterium HGW-Firmicutes-8]|nr:MAG: peptidase [Firmicutes bacterium HGW-Firmicutes-8]
MGKEGSLKDVLEFHRQLTVVDCHCDTILEAAKGRGKLRKASETGHVDIKRMQEGGVGVQFFAAFIETTYKPFSSLTRALRLIDTFYTEVDSCGDVLAQGQNMRQIRNDLKAGRMIAVLGIEGGEALNGDLQVLRTIYRLGVRFLGLTWNQRNQLADGVGESITGGGLTNFGHEVVREMNSLGMIIDLAHISEAGFWDTLEISRHPVIVSHANCYELCNHPRNLNDDQIKALAEKRGVLGLSFVPEFLGLEIASLDGFLDHVDHVAGLVGTETIAIGSDFDGIDQTPVGLDDSRCYPRITAGLLERGYTENEIRGIMGENVLRLMDKVFRE